MKKEQNWHSPLFFGFFWKHPGVPWKNWSNISGLKPHQLLPVLTLLITQMEVTNFAPEKVTKWNPQVWVTAERTCLRSLWVFEDLQKAHHLKTTHHGNPRFPSFLRVISPRFWGPKTMVFWGPKACEHTIHGSKMRTVTNLKPGCWYFDACWYF